MKVRNSRRSFLKNMSCAAVGTTTLFNTLTNLKFINSAAALGGFSDYKALVVILLGGGNDAYNMLIPYDDASHAIYSTTRSNLALPKVNENNAAQNLRVLNYTDQGKEFALHYACENMQSMFNSGRMSFVSNVGTLIEPTSKLAINNSQANLPLGLYSHADQVMHWQTALPQDRVAQGWGGKIADMFQAGNQNQNISMNLSLSGSNIFQTGNNTVEFALYPGSGAVELEGISAPWEVPTAKRNVINSMIDQYYDDVFKKTYVDIVKIGKDGAEEYNQAINGITLQTEFPTYYNVTNDTAQGETLTSSLELVAKTIAAQETLSMNRQIFFIDFGGFDMHEEVLSIHNDLMSILDHALGRFNAAMDEIGMADNVTLFSLSEFARTLTSNGQGSDHAWGSNAFVMGGAVDGGKIIGSYPSLELNSDLELGGGVLLPQISTDQYFGDIAHWFGVNTSDLITLFPNIDNFDSIYNGTPLGIYS